MRALAFRNSNIARIVGRLMPKIASPPPPVRCTVVFDLGGVVIRWKNGPAFRRVARALRVPDVPFHSAVERALIPLERGETSITDFWNEVSRSVDRPIPPIVRGSWTREFARVARPNPGVLRWIAQLESRGVGVACLSNTGGPPARILRARGWLRPFSPVLLSNELGAIKPSRSIFDLARRRVGLPADRLFLLDDSPANVAGARRAGWAASRFTRLDVARPIVERWIARVSRET